MEPNNLFQGTNAARLCSSLAGRYDNPIPTRFLAPIDCLKIPAQEGKAGATLYLNGTVAWDNFLAYLVPSCLDRMYLEVFFNLAHY